MITLFLAVAGLIGTVVGGALKGSAVNKQIKNLELQKKEVDKWYKQSRNEDLLDTSDLRASLDVVRKSKDKESEALNNEFIRSGATTEQKVAKASKINSAFGDTISKIALKDSQYRNGIEDQYVKLLNDIYKQTNSAYDQKSKNITTTINGTIGSIKDVSKGMGR